MIAALTILLASGVPDAAAPVAKRRLETVRVSVDFREAALETVVDFLRGRTRLNFHLNEAPANALVTLTLRNVSAGTVLRHSLRPHDLRAVWRHGAVVIEPRGNASGRKVTRLYDVGTKEIALRDFDDSPGFFFCGTCLAAARYGMAPAPPSAEFGASAMGRLMEIIREHTGDGSWDLDPEASMTSRRGRLIVTQTPAVHRQIEALLRKLTRDR